MRAVSGMIAATVAAGCIGCTTSKTTNTARSATEQLLISTAVDRSLAKVDFRPLRDRLVFVEEKYVDGVDKNYLLASVRHHVSQAGGRLAAKPEQAEVILEVRSGGVGTESKSTYFGSPALSIPGPFPMSLPEIKLINRSKQLAVAKIGLLAYAAKTRRPVGAGGVSLSLSKEDNWFFFGVGPFEQGSVREEVARQSKLPAQGQKMAEVVSFHDGGPPHRIRLTAERQEDGK